MSEKPPTPKEDPVWDLLRQSSRPTPSAQFIDDAVKTARLEAQDGSAIDSPASKSIWWRQLFSWQTGLTVGGSVAAAAAAVVLLIIAINDPAPQSNQSASNPAATHPERTHQPSPQSSTSTLELLDDTVAAETLSFASDHPDAFSDAELINLIIH